MSLENDINALVKSVGLELYDTVVVNENDEVIYRVSVVSPDIEDGKRKSISLESCVELTHLISPLLDVNAPVSGDYRLEVGSAGIERKLSNLEQFKKSTGEKVSFLCNDKSKYKGLLESVEGTKITILTTEGAKTLDYGEIAKAKTYFEW